MQNNPFFVQRSSDWFNQDYSQQQQPQYLSNAPSWGSDQVSGFGDSSTYLDEQETGMFPNQSGGGGNNFGSYVNDASAGFAAGAANSQPVGDFNVDQYAGFKGSGEGLMKGGVIGAIVGGVTAQIGQFRNVNENLRNLDTGVNGTNFDAYGRPTYNGQAFGEANEKSAALGKGIRKLNKTHLDPATNLISSFSGTRRKMKRKQAELLKNIAAAKQDYNRSDVDFRNSQAAMDTYYKNLNNSNRMNNLYRFRSN